MSDTTPRKERSAESPPRPPLFRLCFWLILAVFLVLVVWWTVHIPYDEEALRYAVPADAVFVSRHERLAERWRDLAANSVVQTVAAKHGLELAAALEGPAAAELDRWLDFLAPRTTIVAYAPRLEGVHAPAWTVSTWIGGRALLLRTGLGLGKDSDLKRTRLEDGSTIWTLELPGRAPEPQRYSFAVLDGVLFGCLTTDPEGVRWLSYKMQGRIPGLRHPALDDAKEDRATWHARDAGWLGQWSRDGAAELRYRLRQCDARGLEGTVVLKRGRELPGGEVIDEDAGGVLAEVRQDAGHMLARAPDLLVVSRYGALVTAARLAGWGRLLDNAAVALPGLTPRTVLFAGLYGGEASGRILGLRVPTVFLGLQRDDAQALVDGIDRILDRLNAANGWGLIPRPTGGRVAPAVVVDATRGGAYSSLNEGERVAISARNHYLLLASNLRALQELPVGRREPNRPRKAAHGLAADVLWLPQGEMPRSADAYFQAECAAAGQSIRDALAVATLGLMVNDHPARGARLQALAAARDRVEWMQALGRMAAWVDVGNDSVRIDLRVEDENKSLEAGGGMR